MSNQALLSAPPKTVRGLGEPVGKRNLVVGRSSGNVFKVGGVVAAAGEGEGDGVDGEG